MGKVWVEGGEIRMTGYGDEESSPDERTRECEEVSECM